MEAEYVALSEATQQAIWLRRLLGELNVDQNCATIIHEDNKGCMDFVALDQQKRRSKHIDTRYHYTKERCASGEIELRYCASEDMIADVLTKPLGPSKMTKFASEMGLVPTPNRGG
ncbi:hypothetical protein RP20_CCG011330 [Aedes albopictus]|nr:hypothetical protein RP20_CCG002293 [Aedes albopictus]KXJ75659.1 hypothetical protein RP20_CCG011330 [Aedes albopictus]